MCFIFQRFLSGDLLKPASSNAGSARQDEGGNLDADLQEEIEPGFDSHHQRFPSPDVHQEDQDQGGGQLDQSDGDEAGCGNVRSFAKKQDNVTWRRCSRSGGSCLH